MVEARSEARQRTAAKDARDELLAALNGDFGAILDRRVDRLRYLAERDSQAIASSLVLARREPADVQARLRREVEACVQRLSRTAKEEEDELTAFSRLLRAR
jgi:hypothetical protein